MAHACEHMTLIRETAIAHCPFSAAIEYATCFFADHATLSLEGTLALQTDALTTFEVVRDTTDTARFHHALHLDWSPDRHLPLPRFSGLLTVRPDSTRTELILEGTYEPPFGLVGQVFDGLFGKQVAHGTVRALLRQIATSIEGQWQHFGCTMPDIEALNLRSGVSASRPS